MVDLADVENDGDRAQMGPFFLPPEEQCSAPRLQPLLDRVAMGLKVHPRVAGFHLCFWPTYPHKHSIPITCI